MNTSIKPLKEGEFGVSLKEGVHQSEYDGEEEIEIFSTWVKVKWTRISLPTSAKQMYKLKELGTATPPSGYRAGVPKIDITSSSDKGLTIRNDVDSLTLGILLSWNIISEHLYQYCVNEQVDEIIFTYTSQT